MINGFTAYDSRKERWLLLLLSHHLTLDHTALDILFEEIQMHQLGQADLLPAPLPFRNFVAQARLGIKPEEHEAFFREMLADVDEPTAPFGLLDVLGDGSRVQEANQTVATDWRDGCANRPGRLGISAASLFHLAWAAVVSRTSGREDVVFGTVLFGRMQGGEGAERVLGIVHQYPAGAGAAGPGQRLEQVREVQTRLAGLLRHEHAPLSLAQRCSAVQAPAPLFSALLNYRHSQDRRLGRQRTPHWQGIEVLIGRRAHQLPDRVIRGRPGRRVFTVGANPVAGGAGTAVRPDAHGAGQPDHGPGKRAGHRHAPDRRPAGGRAPPGAVRLERHPGRLSAGPLPP